MRTMLELGIGTGTDRDGFVRSVKGNAESTYKETVLNSNSSVTDVLRNRKLSKGRSTVPLHHRWKPHRSLHSSCIGRSFEFRQIFRLEKMCI